MLPAKPNPKIQNILDAISRNEISVALKEINSLLSKQKSKEKLTPEVLETIKLLRGLCQVRSEQFGEARNVILGYIKDHAKDTSIDSDIQTWLGYISSGVGTFEEIKTFLDPLQPKKVTEEKTALFQLGLPIKAYDFKGAQSTALRLYKDLKLPKYMLASILFNFYALTKGKEEQKDLAKALELPFMFINKLKDELKITEEPNALENVLNRQVIKLYVEILDKQNKKPLLLQALGKFSNVYEDNYEKYFDYLLNLYKQEDASKEAKKVQLNKYTEIFISNNNLDTYRLCFNLYKQFTVFLINHIPKEKVAQSSNLALESAQAAGESDTSYQFSDEADFDKLLGVFWKSLNNSLKVYDEKFKDHAHYRNAVKAVLSCKLEILRQIMFVKVKEGKSTNDDALVTEYMDILRAYTKHFLRILTFPDEILPSLLLLSNENQAKYLSFLKEEVSQLPEKSVCIGDVNYLKLWTKLQGVDDTFEAVEGFIAELLGKYTNMMKVLYDNKKIVEKGERLDNDDYIVILVDAVIKLMDQKGLREVDEKIFGLIIKTLYILEIVLLKTPYNYDLKAKALQLYGRFSVTEKVLDIYKTMDIKAVQTETLGYVFYGLHASLRMMEPLTDHFRENIRFHVESQKESRESLMACIKHENLEKVEEFYEWDKLMQRSYFKHISYLHFAEQELRSSLRKEASSTESDGTISNLNFEFLVEQIFKHFSAHLAGKSQEKFTLNFDVKTLQRNLVVAAHTDKQVREAAKIDAGKVGKIRIDYLTALNNPLILGIKAYRLDILYNTVQENTEKKVERLTQLIQGQKEVYEKVNLEGFYDLRQFERRTNEGSLLYLDAKEGYEYEFVKEMVEFELENIEFEHTLARLYAYWLDIVVKKEEKDGAALLKETEEKFEKILANLERSFHENKKEPWRIFNIHLRKLARVAEDTIETLEVLGNGLQHLKSGVTKSVKKFNDAKAITNLYKNTQGSLKSFKEKIETAFDSIGKILAEISAGVKGNESYLLKDYIGEVEKLFDAEVYNIAQVRKSFVVEVNRSFEYLITTFLGKLKERSKALKVLAA